MTEAPVLVENIGAVLRLTLNRPHRRNALDDGLIASLDRALARAENDPECRAVVLSGAGSTFCAGGDLNANAADTADAVAPITRQRTFLAVAQRLLQLPKPTVAAVNGAAVGAGCSLALVCDEVVLASDARLGLGFLRVGLPPDLLSAATLQRRAGWTVAAELLHSGRLVPAEEAVQLRLATLVADGPVKDVALARAQALAELSPFAFAATKELLRSAWPPIQPLAGLEALLVGVAVTTPEFQEATARFRKPPAPESP